MRTCRATPRCAAGLLVLLLGGLGLADPPGHAGNEPFTIINENTGKCIKPLNDWIVPKDCDNSKDMLWKWVSQHRLFHLQSQKCLGIDITKSTDSLRMFSCDSSAMLWWKCEHHSLYGAAQYRLALKDGHVIASTNSSDFWKKGGSEKSLCDEPYHEIYTRDGNSFGRPCEFPFFVNGTWHHECVIDETHSGPWCATTLNYKEDQKWGICLMPESGCDTNWEKKEQMGSCYQFNTQASISWKEAYVSCQNQGADLLSINSAAELTYLTEKEDIARIFWIGLNQLYTARGWEWSDHKPLNFLNWDPDMPSAPTIGGSSCASMNADSGLWQSSSCEAQLPYICKKPLTDTVELADVWTYSLTHCDAGWQPNNGFCYLLVNESDSWDNAHMKCKAYSGDLISIHSLADVEVVVTKLHNGDTKEEIWTGLKNTNTPTLFQWSDGTEVTLTYWNENQPNVPYNKTPNCVSYFGKLGQWKVQSCEEKLKYVCKKKGEKINDTDSEKICPPEEGWKRHGETCYKIYKDEVPFGTQCNLTITSRFEQEYLNDMIKKYTKSQNKYFWTGLTDKDKLGEYSWSIAGGRKRALTFSNWNYLEPAFPGGCVAMSSERSLGKWEVKDCKSFRALSICKKISGPTETEEAAPKPKDLTCPEGWHTVTSSPFCYKLFHRERIIRKRNWEEAERFCQALGAHLPSFSHTSEIREFLQFLMDQFSDQRWMWIGLNKRSPDLQGSWQWSDYTPVSTVTMPNELQQDYDIRDCAAVKAVHWPWRRMRYFYNDREYFHLRPFACDTKLEWVCQIPKGQTPKTPDWYNPERAGIHGPPVIIEGSEYWFVAEPQLNYEEAVLYCAGNHSSLATLTSFTDLKAIKNKIANISGEEQKWWLRTIEQSVDHRFFHSRYPWHHFHAMFEEECFSIAAKSWMSDLNKLTDCGTKLPFICEKYNVSSLEKYSPDSAAKIKCSGDWIPFQNKCFLKIKPKTLTFTQASDVCQSYGGTLPSVLSQREQDFITHLLPGMETTLWIGLRWTAYEKINRWTDNQELTYSNFNPLLVGRWLKLPTNIFDEDSHYHCAMMVNIPKSRFIGTWNFTACSEHHTLFLCQKYSEMEDIQTLKNASETIKYLNNLYKIILKNLTWFDALTECHKANMQLVSITDPYQQAFLTVQAIQHNSSLWIGLSSQDDELNFHWSDGKHLQFSRWDDNNEQLEACVVLDTDGFWKTAECDVYQPGAICYYPGNETAKEVKPTYNIQCPSPVLNTPWIPFQNSCYNFLITKNRHTTITQEEVHSKCQKLNPKSHILSIRDENENNFVLEQLLHFNYMASWVLLGLTYESNSLMWTDKTRLSYTNWKRGRPDIKNNKFFAGLNTEGLWDIQPFNVIEETLYFQQHSILACKIEMVDYKEEYNTTLPQFIPYEDVIYNVIQKKLTWYEALQTCYQNGGHLASVHDQKGQLFLEDIAKRDGYPLWVGLSSHDGKESNFEWSDGSAFDYIPWKDKISEGNCVVLDPNGIWRHEKCSSVQDGAICYTLKTRKEVSSYTYSSRCPTAKQNKTQWVQYKGHCYTSDQSLHSFLEAKKFCSELDNSAAVVTIMNEDENKFVSKLMRENNNITMRVWLGMIIHSDKTSHWLDGSEVTFVKWADKSKSGSGKCGILLASNETWKNVDCTPGYGRVVCKIPLSPDYRGIGITFAVLCILALIIGLILFLRQRKRLPWPGFFSSVRYEQGVNEDEIMLPTFHD